VKRVRMSPSALRLHFKGVTAMSPLQYQKRLRLQEARWLMLGEGLDAASAAFRVGTREPLPVQPGVPSDVRRPPAPGRGRTQGRSSTRDMVWLSTSQCASWLLISSNGWFINRHSGGKKVC
jgi:transcriptional regulator GlxA family with amidase domain